MQVGRGFRPDEDSLPPPDELAQEIADDLQTAYEQFASLAEKVKG
jgi:hypothetical protein